MEQFEAFKEKAKKEIINSKIDPYYGFGDSVSHAVLANTGRQFFVNEKNLDSINYDRMLELYRQRTADINGMAQQASATAQGLTLAAAKSRLQRARVRLKEQLTRSCQVWLDAQGKVCCYTPRPALVPEEPEVSADPDPSPQP